MLKTIDELLVWLEKSSTQYGAGMDASAREAIRAILEQHHPDSVALTEADLTRMSLEAIRAFVERVCRKRFYEYPPSTELESAGFYFDCIDELEAMEAEVKE